MKKINLIEIPVKPGDDIGELLNKLVEHHNKGEYNYYLEIYGNKFYSKDINYDKAFTLLVGCTPLEHKRRLEETRIRENIRKEALKTDALTNLDYRIMTGKKAIIEPKWPIWEEFVRNNSTEPFYTEEIDIILKYIELLNTNAKTSLIGTIFTEQFPEVGDWYTSVLLTNIAKFHERGIELFEYLRDKHKSEGNEVSDSKPFLDKQRDINFLLKLGENIETATTIASNRLVNINICGMDHLVLVSENNNMMGAHLDYMLIGEYINPNTHIIYIIDGTKVNAYLTLNGETIDINVNGALEGPYPNQVEITETDSDILDIQEEYEVAYSRYVKQDIETLLKVLKNIRELTQESRELMDKLVLEEVFYKYKENIMTLKKSAK